MRLLTILMTASLALSTPASAQFWDTTPKPASPKPASKPSPAPANKPAPEPEPAPVPASTEHVDPSSMNDPFVVLFSDKGEVVACRQVRGVVRFIDPPRKPFVFEQSCETKERVGLTETCTRYVLKETTEATQTTGTKIGFWDRLTGTYQVWSGNALIVSKKANLNVKGPGC